MRYRAALTSMPRVVAAREGGAFKSFREIHEVGLSRGRFSESDWVEIACNRGETMVYQAATGKIRIGTLDGEVVSKGLLNFGGAPVRSPPMLDRAQAIVIVAPATFFALSSPFKIQAPSTMSSPQVGHSSSSHTIDDCKAATFAEVRPIAILFAQVLLRYFFVAIV